ncbi:hypothetical protein P153DRAFT_371550 [Dothidotthia symphoricarpi CBS 119687]|uniref:HNH nuclease domain-containing protein n=1 Tax=Dothidotthia symphoricarpi CBS 119687 TaxID=1392245 RepID=A0A6A5ZVA5_9PLEO|nr:uncharacterized protein P153DRAFT_371550 [Dothidotthia symphoricarpi CBS 119687]KAF2123570.1 hypothetical protein P153DRAFT_371550 [Dothidotthia symphoricarpi CBS 119687]
MAFVLPPPPQLEAPELPRSLPIIFRHPGYDDTVNVLFMLYAPDAKVDSDEQNKDAPRWPALYAQVALDACALVADNRTGGWLSRVRDAVAGSAAQVDPTSMLHQRDYYFHLKSSDGSSDPYPVVPNFREWSFPHDAVPVHWLASTNNKARVDNSYSSSNLTVGLKVRDGTCRMSGCREEAQVSHVVPAAEEDWWKGNYMAQYGLGTSAATPQNTANALLLRADLHLAFDKPRFAFVPKPAGDNSMRIVTHLLEPSAELQHLYHNRELHPSAVGGEMLFARFAWSIFPLVSEFLCRNVDRRLALQARHADLLDDRGYVSAAKCKTFTTAGIRQEKADSKKRKSNPNVVSESEDADLTEVEEQAEPQDGDALCLAPKRRRSGSAASLSPSGTLSPESSLSTDEHPVQVESTGSTLAQEWLDVERKRSDPSGLFEKEREWIQEVWNGKSMSGNEVLRFLQGIGHEIIDNEAD